MVKLKGSVECEGCSKTADIEVEVGERELVTGERVDTLDPRLPEGWRYFYGQLLCEEHAKE